MVAAVPSVLVELRRQCWCPSQPTPSAMCFRTTWRCFAIDKGISCNGDGRCIVCIVCIVCIASIVCIVPFSSSSFMSPCENTGAFLTYRKWLFSHFPTPSERKVCTFVASVSWATCSPPFNPHAQCTPFGNSAFNATPFPSLPAPLFPHFQLEPFWRHLSCFYLYPFT